MQGEQQLILVNERDEQVGVAEKMSAHREGLMHRAFSVFIFDSQGRMLLQQRAREKYHGGLLWTNACCSHPYPEEDIHRAAERRLQEELGFTTALQKVFEFTYYAEVGNGLIEYEYDHVFVGEYEQGIRPNSAEVSGYVYKPVPQIRQELTERPQHFTAWFRIAFPRIDAWWKEVYKSPQA